MTILENHQFEILPTPDALDGFVFGIRAGRVSIDGENGFDPGAMDWINQDSTNTRRGTRAFGRDVKAARTWAWASHTDVDTVAEAVEVLEDFSVAWSPELLVRDPGALTAVRYRLANRDRRVFGRPRQFSAPPSNMILSGFVPIDHTFELVDSFSYADVESSAEILYSSSTSGGGFILPAQMPITTLPSEGNGSGQIAVGGTARAYPIVRFNGPWTNPVMDTGDWVLAWNGSIPAGDYVEIDCRPWPGSGTVLNASGASVVEGLSRRTWLEDCWFAPRTKPQVALSGIAPSGGASATIRWRDTFTSY